MRHLKYLLLGFALGILCPVMAQGQTNWEELPHHNVDKIKVLYLSSEGFLYGYSVLYNTLYYREYESNEWITIPNTENRYFRDHLIKEIEDEVHFANDLGIFRHDPFTNQVTNFISIEDYFLVEDFEQLNNGNIIVSETFNLYLYNSSGDLIDEVEWSEINARLLIGPNKNYLCSYGGFTAELIEFSDDLSFFGTERSFPYRGGRFYVHGQNMYTSSGYSEDEGLTWKNYREIGAYSNSFTLVDSNELVFSDYSAITIADREGRIKDRIEIPENISDVSTNNVIANNDFVLFTSSSCEEELGFVWNRVSQDWEFFDNAFNGPFASNVRAGSDDNVFTKYCSRVKYRYNNISTWEDVIVDPVMGGVSASRFLDVLPNDNIFFSGNSWNYLSIDKGLTWTRIEDLSSVIPDDERLISNSSGSYFYNEGGNSVFETIDYGNSWQELDLQQGVIADVSTHTITSSKKFIYYDRWDDLMYSYDINSGTNRLLTYQGQSFDIDHLASSFSGEIIYAFKIGSEPKLYRSINGGESFTLLQTELDLNGANNVFVDQFDNIYLFGHKVIYISQDLGETWEDISPQENDIEIQDLDVSQDGYIYLATLGSGLLKSGYINGRQQYLEVKLALDDNGNCTVDDGEIELKERLITVENISRPTNENGIARFYLKENSYNINVEINEDLFELCENDIEVDLSQEDSTMIEISAKTKMECAELSSSLSSTLLRRCFENTYYVEICNRGTMSTENMTISLTLDEYFDDPVFSIPMISSNGNVFQLDGDNLGIDECLSFYFTVTVSCDAALGQEHCVEIDVNAENTCNVVLPGVTKECRENIGSYDPNDKRIIVNGSFNAEIETLDDEIEYFIRFQNTGTDTAFTVKIVDPIGEKFNIKSIRPLVASHDYEWGIEKEELIIEFKEILLVDSFTNEPLSHGFIKFKIELEEGVSIGDQVENTAYIFFDFNDPVETNTVVSVVGPNAVKESTSDSEISVFPNPTSKVLNYVLPENMRNIDIVDMTGKIWSSCDVNIDARSIDVSGLPGGVYILNISNEEVKYRTKFVVMN